jgi:hypothetical protein
MPEAAQGRGGAATARIYAFPTAATTLGLPRSARERAQALLAHWWESGAAEPLVRELIDEAPDSLGARIVAYRYYFYRHRHAEAAHWALACLHWLALRLDLPSDWYEVQPDMAGFTHWHAYPCLWLQSLNAYGYGIGRLGKHPQWRAVQEKLAELDPGGQLAAARLRPMPSGNPRGCCQAPDEEEWRLPEGVDEPI